jgi:small subunit ribosomal protein S13
MVFILGKTLRDNKTVWAALTQFYGIGQVTAKQICNTLSIHHQCRMFQLPDNKFSSLAEHLSSMTIESDLRRKVQKNIQTLVDIGCYRGTRHAAGLPVHGQRTRNNAKTAKKMNGKNLKKKVE